MEQDIKENIRRLIGISANQLPTAGAQPYTFTMPSDKTIQEEHLNRPVLYPIAVDDATTAV
jgi:hypothetical protein